MLLEERLQFALDVAALDDIRNDPSSEFRWLGFEIDVDDDLGGRLIDRSAMHDRADRSFGLAHAVFVDGGVPFLQILVQDQIRSFLRRAGRLSRRHGRSPGRFPPLSSTRRIRARKLRGVEDPETSDPPGPFAARALRETILSGRPKGRRRSVKSGSNWRRRSGHLRPNRTSCRSNIAYTCCRCHKGSALRKSFLRDIDRSRSRR